ncbi:DUF6702 family protein [Hymenobacter humi]|uniref:DUF6702 family protein n=1 Tax=Hymenobacter humi TaxID=1411620 RepID=A0ABW2U603_9BACT
MDTPAMRLLSLLRRYCCCFPGWRGAGPARLPLLADRLRYNAAKKQLELSVKVFTDDFETALSQGQPAHVSLDAAGPRPWP